ncbi:thiamine pyrophosphate-dependent enzyme [Neorhizobium sp. JUb45]|uniref:alpha-keto acid decarboxylase family protein n=1 Tax=Neorhizobium sp. JUb45 TaxID=2485113 RepID=UPI0010481EA0|nr:thiamine pyrophosphate-dependent enzyme [Neorhizobium sp. JUb45]TCQ98237.1 indolepyruvate decarboxylase [Neorhizobium sp. JUb45]
MTDTYTVGNYLVDRLHQLGLQHLFSIAGDYSIEWVDNYVEQGGIQVIQEVNELNGGYAADGYARLKGIGALCVTYSAGSLSATNAIAGAFVEKVPVVLIAGAPSIKKALTFEQTGYSAHHFITNHLTDLQVFEYITAAAVRIDSPQIAPMQIDYALTQCITQRRPVYIELLEDMVDLACPQPLGTLTAAPVISDPDSLSQTIAQIGESLRQASNPLLWIGIEIDRFGLQAEVEKLMQKLHIPYVTEFMSKAVLSENDAQFAGVFDGRSSSPAVQELMKKSDFALGLGVWLTDINDLGWPIDFAKTAFASFDTFKFGAVFNAQVSLADLIDGLLQAPIQCRSDPLPEYVFPEPVPGSLTDEISYQGFYDFIRYYIDSNMIIGSDASLNYFGSMLLKIGTPGGFIVQSSYSTIGYMAAAATGASLAKDASQRVVVFSGDGGFQMTAQCLSTQTRFGLNPIIFVIDNGVYGVEQWLADASVFATKKPFHKSCILHRWNYSKLADVFGCKGWEARTYGDLKDAVIGALANLDSPSIIQVVVPSWSIPDNARWKEN